MDQAADRLERSRAAMAQIADETRELETRGELRSPPRQALDWVWREGSQWADDRLRSNRGYALMRESPRVLDAAVRPLAQQHPLALLALAAVGGALLVRFFPGKAVGAALGTSLAGASESIGREVERSAAAFLRGFSGR